jgi:hypothetical protein
MLPYYQNKLVYQISTKGKRSASGGNRELPKSIKSRQLKFPKNAVRHFKKQIRRCDGWI